MNDEKETLALIGMTKDELRQRVVKSIVQKLLYSEYGDENGETWEKNSQFMKDLDKYIKKSIDESVGAIAEAHVVPVVNERIENCVLQETTRWGEPKGKAISFKEYLLQRADYYMTEEVDHNGKPKDARDSYGWRAAGTRIAYMIEKHLHYTIKSTMEEALKNANSSIVDGIQKTVKIKLQEIANKMKFEVKMPR